MKSLSNISLRFNWVVSVASLRVEFQLTTMPTPLLATSIGCLKVCCEDDCLPMYKQTKSVRVQWKFTNSYSKLKVLFELMLMVVWVIIPS